MEVSCYSRCASLRETLFEEINQRNGVGVQNVMPNISI